ncbi:TPA: two-component system sensor histidine kinase CreC [Salmonella enterica subsp. enterica serovar Orientalis]|nr:two-component system sensor histidine kinase CreC [Salmonella enterica subsp. enterica]EHP4800934.1 two-component system sensor histidine kinase CreC [Salmonella enterica subsp. enterica serovar Sangera]HEC7999999.1 two-component system sensor histidine kinase CreC [Salmonella enterica subsp. enterica serovar Orientalis]EDU9696213.1 two-component system sensor histidine kinase CreC [Salmonella enterica subsp. enterica]HEC8756153.1 two-component system sensor histidine kinase CreC [Salmonella
MRIGMRLLLGYFLIVAVAAVFVLSIFVQEIKPGVRRATEGTLIDTATLLAALARDDLLSGNPTNGQLAKAFAQLQHRPFRANISGIVKVRNEYHVYMTDAQGKVLFDSENRAVGQDYSRWNDVWLTLHGQYGARSTAKDSADPNSTVMYVAAPIISDGRIIGVLTVGKPNAAMAPVIKRSERRILWASAVLLGIALAIGAGMVWWINRSIARLTRYADSVTENRPLALPALGSSELRKLAQALESMRIKLEGKNDIEQYVYALTHELKSPLAAIRGAAEILREGPPADVVTRFTENILAQNTRMQALGNVLDNAIDFTPENGVITLSAQPMGEKAILQVTDSGCGIPDFALPRIFDRFYSLPRENGRKSSGLGLAFVSEAARLLNGEVTLCNRPEGGVLASLTLHRHFT